MNAFRRAVGVISPMVIFILIQYLVTFCATLTFMNSAVAPEAVLNDAQILELKNAAYEMLNKNVVLISGIAAVISIPIFYRMLNKEWMKRPYRLQTLKPVYKKYIYVALVAIGLTVAFNLGVNAFELFRYDVDYARIARGIYSEPLYLQVLAFVFSLLMIFAYKRCGSFMAPMVFHIVSNLSSLAMNQLRPMSSMQYSIGIVLFCMIGLLGLYGLKKGRFFKVISLEDYVIEDNDVQSEV